MFALGLSITTLISHWQARSARAPDRHSVAQQLLRDGQSNQAAYLFVDPSWRAVAHYRAGNYQRAIDRYYYEITLSSFLDNPMANIRRVKTSLLNSILLYVVHHEP